MARRYKRPKPYEPWKISASRLREAGEMLGLTKTIRIKDMADYNGEYAVKWSTLGLYCPQSYKRHVIYLRSDIRRERANLTLWHELIHAYQREHGIDGTKMLSASERPKGMSDAEYWEYYRRPAEVHAREMAEEFVLLLDLTYAT